MATNDQVSQGISVKLETPAAETSPPSLDTYAIQRRGTRVLLQERAPVQLHLRAAELLEISRSGALVQHTIGVRVGEVYRLFLPVQGLELEVLARAVRSSVTQVVPVTGGEGQIVYRTGLEFVELKETVAKALGALVILGSVLLSSLLYLTAAHTTARWTFARETVAGIAGPAAPKTDPG